MILITDQRVFGGVKYERAQVGHVLFHADNKDTSVLVKDKDLFPLFARKGTHLDHLPQLRRGDVAYVGRPTGSPYIISWTKVTF